MKFLLPNYSCLQNPWLGGYRPQIPVLSVLCPQLNLLNPPPPKQNSWVRHCVCTLKCSECLQQLTYSQLLKHSAAWCLNSKHHYFKFNSPRKTAQAVLFLNRIRWVPGSDLGRQTDSPDRGFLWFSSTTPGECLKEDITASFHVISNLSFLRPNHTVILYCTATDKR